jgi:hypothetical protein
MLASPQSSASIRVSPPRDQEQRELRIPEDTDEIIWTLYLNACAELRDARIAFATADAKYEYALVSAEFRKWLVERAKETAGSETSISSGSVDPGEANK